MIDYHTPRFKTSQAAAAAGISASTLRTYLSRKRSTDEPNPLYTTTDLTQWRRIGKQAEGGGLPNFFSLRDALAFAVAAELVKVGVEPAKAFDISWSKFSHAGADADDDRGPAQLFDVHERGETLLIYYPLSGEARVVAANSIKSAFDFMGMRGGSPSLEEAAIVVVLNYIEQRAFAALGVARK